MDNTDKSGYLEADKTGRLILPQKLTSHYSIKPGSRIYFTENQGHLQLQFPARLAKLYIEPTSLCNLGCRTCIRNVWKEPMGNMPEAVFDRIIEGLKAFLPPPTVFFGGFGEPLFHPDIIKMINQVKMLGIKVELITNGTLLTPDMSRELVKVGLDMLWVSLDGATPESYADIRLGAALPQVLDNLSHLQDIIGDHEDCGQFTPEPATQLGIVFVAMKRNINDLPAVLDIGQRFGAKRFIVTNVLPYTKEMIDEVLYYRSINDYGYRNLSLPEIDVNEITYSPIYQTIRKISGSWAGISSQYVRDRCPFVASGAGAISWDGNLSPCLPLMHDHTSYLGYLQHQERFSRRWAIGNVIEQRLPDLWNTPEHLAFRERVQFFTFSPCTTCGTCELIEKNEEDCCGNTFPTCGGCLWAQGVIQCP